MEVTTDYIDINYLKTSLRIKDDVHIDDAKLAEIITNANQEIDMKLKPYADDIPLETGSNFYVQAQKCAAAYARMEWWEYQYQNEKYVASSEIYEKKIKSLTEALEAARTDRTEVLFITDSASLDPTFQPANIDEYLTRVF